MGQVRVAVKQLRSKKRENRLSNALTGRGSTTSVAAINMICETWVIGSVELGEFPLGGLHLLNCAEVASCHKRSKDPHGGIDTAGGTFHTRFSIKPLGP